MWQILLVFLETIVLSLCLHMLPKSIKERGRNDHTVIVIRTIILLIFIIIVNCFHSALLQFKTISNIELWGLSNKLWFVPIITSSVHICILFAGTIIQDYYYAKKTQQSFLSSILECSSYTEDIYIDLRTLFFAPILEEILYRGTIFTFLLHSGYSLFQSILITSLAFGSCHFHHIFDCIKSGLSVSASFFRCLFMFIYTTLFGILVSYVYVRTGSILAAAAVHALCNFFSIPSTHFMSPSSCIYEYRYIILYVYVAGIICYATSFTSMLNPIFLNSSFSSLL